MLNIGGSRNCPTQGCAHDSGGVGNFGPGGEQALWSKSPVTVLESD